MTSNTVVVIVDARRLGEGGKDKNNNNIKHNVVAPAPLLSLGDDSNSDSIMIHSLDEKKEEVKKVRIEKQHHSNRKKKNKIENKKKEIKQSNNKKIYKYDIITNIGSKIIYEIESMIENATTTPFITTTTPLRRRSLGVGVKMMMMDKDNAVSSSTSQSQSQSQSRLLPVSVSNNNNNHHNNNLNHRSLYQAWARDNNNNILWWIWLIIALCAVGCSVSCAVVFYIIYYCCTVIRTNTNIYTNQQEQQD